MRQVFTAFIAFLIFLVLAGVFVFYFASQTTSRAAVEVPDLLGLDTASALKNLEGKGLKLAYEGEAYSTTFAKGLIMSQDPEARQSVKTGRQIRVVLSRGLKSTVIPDLQGVPLKQARERLESLRLKTAVMVEVRHPSMSAGTIIATEPPAGEAADEGEEVALLASLGPETGYAMPDFVGSRLQEALLRIQREGLVLANLQYRESTLLFPNSVLDQIPGAGARIAKGQEVTLTVSRAPGSAVSAPANRYEIIRYSLPEGLVSGKVEVAVLRGGGEEMAFGEVLQAGRTITIPVEVAAGTRVRILLNGRVVEEKTY